MRPWRSHRWGRAALSTGIGLGIVALLVGQIERLDFSSVFQNFSIFQIAIAFCFYGMSTWLRSLRWKGMLQARSVKTSSLFYVTAIHNLLNHLLPARTGEVSYVLLLQKTQSIPASRGTATLLLARVIDLAAMASFFMISILFFWDRMRVSSLKLFLITLLGLPLLLIVFIGIFSRRGTRRVHDIFLKLGLMRWKLLSWISGFLVRLSEDLHQIKNSGGILHYGVLTFLIWGAKFFAFYVICQNLHFFQTISFGETVLGTTFSELASTLPFYGFAGIGTIEGGWTLGFWLLGFPKEKVILNAFAFHFYLLSFAVILGVSSLLLLKRKLKRDRN